MDRLSDPASLHGWIPTRLFWDEGRPAVDWCYLENRGFKDSSFDQIVSECLYHPFNLLFGHQTPIEVLGEWSAASPGLRPTGFIFHVSHTASTLVSRALAALSLSLVLAEARPIDSILRAQFYCEQVTDEQRIMWLRWMVSALSQRTSDGPSHFFVKFHAWNMVELPLIRQAFPGVPWIFIYGEPIEVLASQLDHRGAHMIPGVISASLFGINHPKIPEMEVEEYGARVLAGIYQAALTHSSAGGMLVNYAELPDAIWSSITNFLRIPLTETEAGMMKVAARRYVQNSAVASRNDTARNRKPITEQTRRAALEWLDPIYQELEKVRCLKSDKLKAVNRSDSNFPRPGEDYSSGT
jgi:hypothetical protein